MHCRLDRALANSSWSDRFPLGCCHYLPFEESDHRPIFTSFTPISKKRRRSFRYDRRLRHNEEVRLIVEQAWEASEDCSVSTRISNCRRAISKWSKTHYQNSKKEIVKLQQTLDAAMSDPSVDDKMISSINQNLLLAYKSEEEFWKQRSRQLWLALGDLNTGYFHASTKSRRARNRLSVIEDDNGIQHVEEEKIAATISQYFQNIFTSSNPQVSEVVNRALKPCISQAVNEKLFALPSDDEIREEMFAIHPDKAPGPDGFSASFFQSNWEAVGPAICCEIKSFFVSGSLPNKINNTNIRLIPKITTPIKVSDYRPIALCNVYYKAISKLLAIRLKPVLHEIISEFQSAFVPDRAISDNVLITHEVLHYLKSSDAEKHCSMAVKTDISKAYDRLEWPFIRQV